MKLSKQFILPLVVSIIVTILLINPHSGEEYDRAPVAIIIGFLVLCLSIIIMRRSKSAQEFINKVMPAVSSFLSLAVFCVVAFASRSYILGIFAAFLVLSMLIGPRNLWNFMLDRISELSRAIQGKG
jgi:O-antigen/teichoic acid export membrane protein